MQFLPHDNLPYVYAIIRTQSNIRNSFDALTAEDNMAIKQLCSFIEFYGPLVKVLTVFPRIVSAETILF